MSLNVRTKDWLQRGFELYKANFWLLLGVNAIALCLSSLTGGVLSGPLFAGVALVTLALVDEGERPVVSDVFKGFEVFLQSFLYTLVISLAVLISNIIPPPGIMALLVGLVLGTLTIFSIFLIAEEKMEFWVAIVSSYNMVKANFWEFLGLHILVLALSGVGVLVCYLGLCFTLPFYFCVLTIAYRSCVSSPRSDMFTVQPEPPEGEG